MIGWVLVAVVVCGLVVVGATALVAPAMSAAQYGIVFDDPRALAFIRAMGARDVVLGVLLGMTGSCGSRELAAWALWATMLIAVVDFVVVAMDAPGRAGGSSKISPRVLHAAGAIGIALAAVVLGRGY